MGTERSLIPLSAQTEHRQGGAEVQNVRQQSLYPVPRAAPTNAMSGVRHNQQHVIPGAPKPCPDICPAPACSPCPLHGDGVMVCFPSGGSTEEAGQQRRQRQQPVEARQYFGGSPAAPSQADVML